MPSSDIVNYTVASKYIRTYIALIDYSSIITACYMRTGQTISSLHRKAESTLMREGSIGPLSHEITSRIALIRVSVHSSSRILRSTFGRQLKFSGQGSERVRDVFWQENLQVFQSLRDTPRSANFAHDQYSAVMTAIHSQTELEALSVMLMWGPCQLMHDVLVLMCVLWRQIQSVDVIIIIIITTVTDPTATAAAAAAVATLA